MKKKLGALWIGSSKDGSTKYMKGVFEDQEKKVKIKIIIFKNTRKEEDKHPDYIIYEAEDKTSAAPVPPVPNDFMGGL